jgi:hypothetical protein
MLHHGTHLTHKEALLKLIYKNTLEKKAIEAQKKIYSTIKLVPIRTDKNNENIFNNTITNSHFCQTQQQMNDKKNVFCKRPQDKHYVPKELNKIV